MAEISNRLRRLEKRIGGVVSPDRVLRATCGGQTDEEIAAFFAPMLNRDPGVRIIVRPIMRPDPQGPIPAARPIELRG